MISVNFTTVHMYLWVGEEGGEGVLEKGGARERGIECILYGYSLCVSCTILTVPLLRLSLSRKNLPGVPSREPYSRPARYQLSYAALSLK